MNSKQILTMLIFASVAHNIVMLVKYCNIGSPILICVALVILFLAISGLGFAISHHR